MDLFKLYLQILRRDPEVTRDDVLFVTIFTATLLLIILLTVVTLVFGDGATFARWLLGR